MKFPKDQAGLLESILPDVLIDKITLENKVISQHRESDPHIQHPRENYIEFENINVIQKLEQNEKVNVTLDLSLKEIISGEPISKWFENKFTKYVKISIIASIDENVTAALSSSKIAINTILNNGFKLKEDSYPYEILKFAFPNEDIYDAIHRNILFKKLNIGIDVSSDMSSYTQHTSEVNANGDTIHNINLKTNFNFNKNINHLALFALSSIDIEALANDYNLSYIPQDSFIKLQNGKISSDIVINNGKTYNKAFVFKKTSGEVWQGPVHENGINSWFTGSSPTSKSEPLVLLEVNNDKIQDFRKFDELQKIQIDLSALENRVFTDINSKFQFLKNSSSLTKPRNYYFSDIFITKSPNREAKMTFAFDHLKMLRENSVYEKLISNASREEISEMLLHSKIKEIKILRRRVKNNLDYNRIGNQINSNSVFNKDEPPVLVVLSSDDPQGMLLSRDTSYGLIKESDYNLDIGNNNLRFFKVVDKSISSITDGVYQYGVEITIQDGIQDYVLSLLKKMRESRNLLNRYLAKASIPDTSKYIYELQDPHVDVARWEKGSHEQNKKGNFNISSGRFTSHFIKEQYEEYAADITAAPWFSAVVEFFKVFDIFTGFFKNNRDGKNIVEQIISFADPYSGTIAGISSIISMMDKFITRVAIVVGDELRTYWEDDILSKDLRKNTIKNIIVNHWFNDEQYDSDFISRGYDYFSDYRYDGLLAISPEQLLDRVREETMRFWEDVNFPSQLLDIEFDNSYLTTGMGYLSPVFVNIDNNLNINLFLQNNINNDYYSILEEHLTTPNSRLLNNFEQQLLSFSNEEVNNISDFLSSLNVSLGEFHNPPVELSSDGENVTLRTSFQNNTICNNSATDIQQKIDLHVRKEEPEFIAAREDIGRRSPSDIISRANASRIVNILTSQVRPIATQQRQLNMNSSLQRSTINIPNQRRNTLTVSSLNLRNQNNIILNLKTDPSSNGFTRRHNISSTNDLSLLLNSFPNQLKSLFIGSIMSSYVKEDFFEKTREPSLDPLTSSKFNFYFNLINKIEVLVGFRDNNIKYPLWTLLTSDIWSRNLNKELLCRMIPYENEELGISRPENLNLPIYNDYFTIKPNKLIKTKTNSNTIKDDMRIVILNKVSAISDKNFNMAITSNIIGDKKPTSFSYSKNR